MIPDDDIILISMVNASKQHFEGIAVGRHRVQMAGTKQLVHSILWSWTDPRGHVHNVDLALIKGRYSIGLPVYAKQEIPVSHFDPEDRFKGSDAAGLAFRFTFLLFDEASTAEGFLRRAEELPALLDKKWALGE